MDTPQTNIQFHFDTTDVSDGLEWIRLGQSAVEEAKEELQAEGTQVSVTPVRSGELSGERGAIIDDLLIGVAGNAISTLLFKAVALIFQRIRRPRAVDIQAGGSKIQINATDSEDTIKNQIASWVKQALSRGGKVTLHPVE